MKNYYLENFKNGEYKLPLVKISQGLNPFSKDGVEIYAVLGYALPYDTMKFLTVLGLLEDAKEKGMLEGVNTLVEATSGSFGLVLAALSPYEPFNISNVVLVMKEDVPLGKRYPAYLFGGQIIHPTEGMSAIDTARQLGGGGWRSGGKWKKSKDGWLNLDQYANIANTYLFEKWAAPQILGQLPNFNVLCAAMGTGGTILGLETAFRKQLDNLTVVGVSCAPGNEVPGARDAKGLKEVSLPWQKAIDQRVEVETKPCYLSSLYFAWKMGLYPGVSGGMAYAGLLKYLKKVKDDGSLDKLRSKDGKIRAVIVFHDNFRPYAVDRFSVFLTADEQKPNTAPLPWKLLWR